MCPLCIGTATLIVSGSSSAGGLAALLLRRAVRRGRPAQRSETLRSQRPPSVTPSARGGSA